MVLFVSRALTSDVARKLMIGTATELPNCLYACVSETGILKLFGKPCSLAHSLGASLTGADFNNDGFADLAIGVPGETLSSIIAAGAVHVIYGSSSGFGCPILPAQIWTQNSVNIDDASEGSDGCRIFACRWTGQRHWVCGQKSQRSTRERRRSVI